VSKIVALVSGGLDSTVMLANYTRQHEVIGLSVNYGQRHKKELAAATKLCRHYGVEHITADLSKAVDLFAGSSQTSKAIEVPEGHYAEESMKQTVVPNRNMVMLSLATALAISRGASYVGYAAHAGDHAIYPDCRPEFIDAMRSPLALCDYSVIRLDAPFMRKTKADIVKLGVKLEVPFGDTWSCYKGGAKHCGKCGTCVERIEAFQLAGADDPTRYASGDETVDEKVSEEASENLDSSE
jgi:7-cyano-7-deazaguanine synthase